MWNGRSGNKREDTQQHVVTDWDPKLGTIFARNRYHPDYSERVAFVSISPKRIPLPVTGPYF